MTDVGGMSVARRLRTRASVFPRSFWLLTAGWFIYVLGYECGYPFESIYLNEKLGISLTAIGLIFGLTQLGGLPAQVVGGAAVDRLGRRPGFSCQSLPGRPLGPCSPLGPFLSGERGGS